MQTEEFLTSQQIQIPTAPLRLGLFLLSFVMTKQEPVPGVPVGLGRVVYGTQLLPCCTIYILRHAAVGEVYLRRVIVVVVGDIGYLPALVGNQ